MRCRCITSISQPVLSRWNQHHQRLIINGSQITVMKKPRSNLTLSWISCLMLCVPGRNNAPGLLLTPSTVRKQMIPLFDTHCVSLQMLALISGRRMRKSSMNNRALTLIIEGACPTCCGNTSSHYKRKEHSDYTVRIGGRSSYNSLS